MPTREDLFAGFTLGDWDGRPTSDEPINRCLSQLRGHLDDRQRPHHYVETLQRRGYRPQPHALESCCRNPRDWLHYDSRCYLATKRAGAFDRRHAIRELERRGVRSIPGFRIQRRVGPDAAQQAGWQVHANTDQESANG